MKYNGNNLINYQDLSYTEKLNKLQEYFYYSTKLSEAIGVSRRTLLNWKNNPNSISPAHRLDIDVMYCKHYIVEKLDNDCDYQPVLIPDNAKDKSFSEPYVANLSHGTIEIESNITLSEFTKSINNDKLPKGVERKTFFEGFNAFATMTRIWNTIVRDSHTIELNEFLIKDLHSSFMQGILETPGIYSNNYRIMGKISDIDTTAPEDIAEEVNRWVFKAKNANTIDQIASLHAYFMLIHPFSDGNGRVGRALSTIQCLNAHLLPPIFNENNKALYYATMEYAMRHGRNKPLINLFISAQQ